MEPIYIQENEDIFRELEKRNISLTSEIRNRIGFISNKTANNYIGYYQFLWQRNYYRFFIIPKIHANVADAEKEKKFIAFLGEYYRLSNTYEAIKKESIQGNIIDFSFEDYSKNTGEEIDNFIRYKYEYALNILDIFFRKHIKTRLQEKVYSSQSIKHKIDVKRNITSLDKANVFQVKKETQFFSRIALVSAHVLRQFKAEKIKHLSSQQAVLVSKTNAVLNKIYKRFTSTGAFAFKDRDIITNRIARLFKKNNESRQVYEALLILIGLEHFRSQETSGEVQKLENMVALFFNPADVYE